MLGTGTGGGGDTNADPDTGRGTGTGGADANAASASAGADDSDTGVSPSASAAGAERTTMCKERAYTNAGNPNFNPGNRLGRRYRIRAVHEYKFYEGTYDTISAMVEELGPVLHLNRGQILRIRNGSVRRSGKFSHVEITDL
jgi:hypothetical protein